MSKYNKNKTVVQKLNDWAGEGAGGIGEENKIKKNLGIDILYTIGNSCKYKGGKALRS